MYVTGFKIAKSGVSLIRFYSLVESLGNNPESVALEHINSGKPTTSLIINKILSNQNLVVTDSKLNQLLNVKGVELDLPIFTPENYLLLDKLTGKSKHKGFFVARIRSRSVSRSGSGGPFPNYLAGYPPGSYEGR